MVKVMEVVTRLVMKVVMTVVKVMEGATCRD